ncbi:hypothetical protein [Streptomyces sp. NPDC048825]|uniref:hypothetical protein n=1 Tax=Streptomyces sp. NPDC048825 TaxID=3365592 RepID=UPI00370F9788
MTVRTCINRRQGNAVTLWRHGKKLAEIKGDMSADDIVKILEAREQAEEPTALTADDQTAPDGP